MTETNNDDDKEMSLMAKVFTRWVSMKLKGTNINNITKDLSNGIILIELAQNLTHKKLEKPYEENPTSTVQNLKNVRIALKIFKNDGFTPIGITSKNIAENNEKQIIELVWQLISFYSINNSFSKLDKFKENVSDANIKNKLLSWAMRRTQNYKHVFAFKPYDLAICALLDSYYPSKVNYYLQNLNNHSENFKYAIDVMNELGIPCLILPEDVDQKTEIDKKSLLTQLAVARFFLEVKPRAKPKRRAISVVQNKPIQNSRNLGNTTAQKNLSHTDNFIKTRIPKRKAKSELKPKKEFSAYPPIIARQKMLNKKKIEDYDEKPIETVTGKQKIEDEIVEDFNENKEEYNERKEEEKQEESKLKDEKEEPIEDQIANDFNENIEEYKERKEKEKKSKKLTKDQIKVEKEIVDDFKENRVSNLKRKMEVKIEKEKLEKEELKREEINPENDRRPTFINIV